MSITEMFTALFDGIEECDEEEQMQKIQEMNGLIDEMNEEEFKSNFTKECFNKIDKMIEEKTLSWGNAIMLLKHVGCCKELKSFFCYSFDDSLLSERMKEMIIEEERRIEEKNERLLVDLCECFTLLNFYIIPDEYRSIIVPPLLKAASKKEGNEETQKEVKMALLALSHVNTYFKIEQELYMNEIKAIIEHYHERHNLTQLAYQSAWRFLIKRFYNDESLEDIIVNDLHFAREARRELEDLSKSVNWKRKEERGKEVKEALVIWRWLDAIYEFLYSNTLWNEELAKLIASLVQMIRASRDNHKDICNGCFDILRNTAINRNVEIDSIKIMMGYR
ncbi:uncharacterized protein MONOS_17983 [Monocercomonoides exilis]|uniref:uncharacterized protein n=1 Tax=Monocercomonoides exilis TaxID=2049356 RepID=UPI00355A0971|nr:hypothetical protein MONOS_17983 [Monocercomonoides exilis]